MLKKNLAQIQGYQYWIRTAGNGILIKPSQLVFDNFQSISQSRKVKLTTVSYYYSDSYCKNRGRQSYHRAHITVKIWKAFDYIVLMLTVMLGVPLTFKTLQLLL